MKWIINSNGFITNARQPKSFFVSEFSPNTVKSFSNCVTESLELEQPVLPIYVESDGGSLFSLNGMLSIIEGARKNGLKFATIVNGCALSAGAYLFCYGDKDLRFLAPSGTLMIHSGIFNSQADRLPDVKSAVDVFSQMDLKLNEKISRHLGKRADWLSKKLKSRENSDWFLTPEEALKEGIASSISTPTFYLNLGFNVAIS